MLVRAALFLVALVVGHATLQTTHHRRSGNDGGGGGGGGRRRHRKGYQQKRNGLGKVWHDVLYGEELCVCVFEPIEEFFLYTKKRGRTKII